jgi:hypothetical protein
MVLSVSKNITLIFNGQEIREDLLTVEDESNKLFETSATNLKMKQSLIAERGNPQPLRRQNLKIRRSHITQLVTLTK